MILTSPPTMRLSRAALGHNLDVIKSYLGSRRLLAVVKDNAYGWGAERVAQVLASLGVEHFAVGAVSEALELQNFGITQEILNMRLFAPEEAAQIVNHQIQQGVFSEQHLSLLENEARHKKRPAKVHVKVDTGLNRFGAQLNEAAALIKNIRQSPHFKLEGVFTSICEKPERDQKQLEKFFALQNEVSKESELWHCVGSYGLLQYGSDLGDAARSGCLLMGFAPQEGFGLNLEPVGQLTAPVIDCKHLQEGENLGFHSKGLGVIKETGHYVFLGIGQRHGLPLQLAQKIMVRCQGQNHPLVRIGGEHAVIHWQGQTPPEIGSEALFLGKGEGFEFTASDWADHSGVTTYAVLSGTQIRREAVESHPIFN